MALSDKLFRVKLSIVGICLRLNLMNFEVEGTEWEEGGKGLTLPVLEKESYFCSHEMLQTLHTFKQGFEILQGLALMSRIYIMSSLWKFAQIWSFRRPLLSSSLHMFSKNLLRVWQFIFLNMRYFLSVLIPPFCGPGRPGRVHMELQALSTSSCCSSDLPRANKAQGTWPETTLLPLLLFAAVLQDSRQHKGGNLKPTEVWET